MSNHPLFRTMEGQGQSGNWLVFANRAPGRVTYELSIVRMVQDRNKKGRMDEYSYHAAAPLTLQFDMKNPVADGGYVPPTLSLPPEDAKDLLSALHECLSMMLSAEEGKKAEYVKVLEQDVKRAEEKSIAHMHESMAKTDHIQDLRKVLDAYLDHPMIVQDVQKPV